MVDDDEGYGTQLRGRVNDYTKQWSQMKETYEQAGKTDWHDLTNQRRHFSNGDFQPQRTPCIGTRLEGEVGFRT